MGFFYSIYYLMSFLPEDYEAPVSWGNYCKFKQGTTTIRIVSESAVWRLDRKDKKAYRTRQKQDPLTLGDKDAQPKHFWSFVVWNYEAKQLQICEITQKQIQNSILALYNNEDRGDPKNYDLKITKEGEKMETKYAVLPRPQKAIDEEIVKELSSIEINMQNIFLDRDVITKKIQDDMPF